MTTHETKSDSPDSRVAGGAPDRTGSWRFGLVCAAIFGFAYALNAATPLLADDYALAYAWGTTTRITGLSDLLTSTGSMYFEWSGRLVSAFLVQAAVLMGRPAFDLVNSAAFLALVLLIYFNANGLRRMRVSLLVGIPLLLWFAIPAFGQSVLWLTGAVAYTWMLLPGLLLVLPFRIHAESPAALPDGWGAAAAIVPLGLVAGWSGESLAPALLLMIVGFIVYFRRTGVPVPKWGLAAAAATLLGAVLLLTAPGNFARAAAAAAAAGTASPSAPLLQTLAERLSAITHAVFLDNLFVLLVAFVLLAVVLHFRRDASGRLSIVVGGLYMGAAFVATYAMVASPQFPGRVWTFAIGLAVTAVGVAYSALDFDSALVRRLAAVLIAAGLLMFAVKFAYVYLTDIRVTARQWAERVAYIDAQKAVGNTDLVVKPIAARTAYNAAFDLKDLDVDPAEWPNVDVARYFGLRSIRSAAATDQPVTP